MTDDNLCFVLNEKDKLTFEHRSVPSILNDYDVLLKILQVGICGSDVHYWVRGYIGDFVVKSPIILGHESSAEVVKCGAKALYTGDRVAIEPGVPCRRCHHCMSGKYNLCDLVEFLATPPFDGSLCQYITHPEDFCFKLPSNVSDEEGALLEPLSVGVHACRRGNVQLGSKVLIIGTGPIGLVNLLVAKSMGAGQVVVVDLDERRLQLASSLGADFVIKTSKDALAMEIASKIRESIGTVTQEMVKSLRFAELVQYRALFVSNDYSLSFQKS